MTIRVRQYFDISGLSKLMNCNSVLSLTLTLSSENTKFLLHFVRLFYLIFFTILWITNPWKNDESKPVVWVLKFLKLWLNLGQRCYSHLSVLQITFQSFSTKSNILNLLTNRHVYSRRFKQSTYHVKVGYMLFDCH